MKTSSIYADINTPLIRNCWYVAGLLSEFTRDLQQRFLLGNSVLMFLSTEGKPVLMQNRCAHRSFPLHHGRLEGDEVVCMYHGLRYNAMGACVNAPMIGRPAPHAKLHHYPTAVRGPLVWAWYPTPHGWLARSGFTAAPIFMSRQTMSGCTKTCST